MLLQRRLATMAVSCQPAHHTIIRYPQNNDWFVDEKFWQPRQENQRFCWWRYGPFNSSPTFSPYVYYRDGTGVS